MPIPLSLASLPLTCFCALFCALLQTSDMAHRDLLPIGDGLAQVLKLPVYCATIPCCKESPALCRLNDCPPVEGAYPSIDVTVDRLHLINIIKCTRCSGTMHAVCMRAGVNTEITPDTRGDLLGIAPHASICFACMRQAIQSSSEMSRAASPIWLQEIDRQKAAVHAPVAAAPSSSVLVSSPESPDMDWLDSDAQHPRQLQTPLSSAVDVILIVSRGSDGTGWVSNNQVSVLSLLLYLLLVLRPI